LGVAGFGQFSIVQSTVTLIGVFSGAGLTVSATKHVAQFKKEDPRRAGSFAHILLTIALWFGAISSAVMYLASPLIADKILGKPDFARELQLSSGLILLGAIVGVQTGIIAGLQEFKAMSHISIFRGAAAFVGMAAGASAGGVAGALMGLVSAELVTVCVAHRCLNDVTRQAGIPLNVANTSKADWAAVLRFAFPAVMSGVVMQPATWYSNLLLVRQPQGYEALALFVAADKWRQIVLFVPTSLSSIMLPLLSRAYGSDDTEHYRNLFRFNVVICLCVLLVPSIILVVLPGPAMSLFGRGFDEGKTALLILSVSSIAVLLNNVLGHVLVSAGRIWRRFFLDVVLAMLMGIAAYYLIPAYRHNGLALANVLPFLPVSALLLMHTRNTWWRSATEASA
jgi:O-antigen/teichoic acid export membrane protein